MTKLCKCGHKKGEHESWSESSWIGAYLGSNYSHCKECGSTQKEHPNGYVQHIFNCRFYRPVNCICETPTDDNYSVMGFDYHKGDITCKCADKCRAKKETEDFVDACGRVFKSDSDGIYTFRDGLGSCTLKKCRCS